MIIDDSPMSFSYICLRRSDGSRYAKRNLLDVRRPLCKATPSSIASNKRLAHLGVS